MKRTDDDPTGTPTTLWIRELGGVLKNARKGFGLLFSADRRLAIQLVVLTLADAVFPQAELMDRVKKLAERIAANGPLAVAEVKRLIHQGQSTTLEHSLALEQRSFGLLFATSDQREGMQAFLAKRKAQFKGN